MDEDGLPKYSAVDQYPRSRHHRRRQNRVKILAYLTALVCIVYFAWTTPQPLQHPEQSLLSSEKLQADFEKCIELRNTPQDPSGPRERNARYLDGHKPVLIRNATVWTGEPAAGTPPEEAHCGIGYSWNTADVFLEYGLIKRVESDIDVTSISGDYDVYEAHGRQLTSGIVDMHSHAGVDTLPELRGWSDDNELSNDITPFVRSIDGFNPLDHQIQVIKSGGVTTSLILPGSGNNMGGEAFVIKHAVGQPDGRTEISAEDMLADPEKHWRYMKMACKLDQRVKRSRRATWYQHGNLETPILFPPSSRASANPATICYRRRKCQICIWQARKRLRTLLTLGRGLAVPPCF